MLWRYKMVGMMKTVIDLQGCQSGSRLGGIGRYALQLTKAMVNEARNDDIWVVLNNQIPDAIANIRSELSSSLPQNRIISFESIGRVSALASSPLSFRTRAAELCREHFIAQLKPDVVYVASLFEGLSEDVVGSVANVSAAHATAVTLYDLIPLAHEKMYLTNEVSKTHYMRKVDQLMRADILLAISEFSRDQGRQLLDYPSDQIVNMSSASGDFFRPVHLDLTEKNNVLAQFGITRKFLMYTGSFDQRKNQKKLIEAFSLLPAKTRADFQLVIVGNGWSGLYEDLRGHGAKYGLGSDELIFTGKVGDDDLLKLYNLCFLFVFPSLSEGFGLPILEAMSCGTPAIGSNATSIPEVIGRSDALFDPTNPSAIAAKILEAVQLPSFYNSLSEHALTQAKKFSWENSARIALDAFREVVSKNAHGSSGRLVYKTSIAPESEQYRARVIRSLATIPDRDRAAEDSQLELAGLIAVNERLLSIVSVSENKSMRVDKEEHLGLVTSWGTKCGVAEYSKWLMRGMPIEFTVFAARSDLLVKAGESFVERCWTQGDEDDLSVLLRRIKESRVTTVLFQFHYGFYNFEALAKLIAALHESNISTSFQLHSTADPPENISPKKLKTLAATFLSCANIFVTTSGDLERLRNIGVYENVRLMPLGVHRAEPTNVPYARDEKDFIIASYGFFLPHKGVHELIRAFALVRATIPTAKLLLVNAEYPIPESCLLVQQANDIVRELKLTESVTLVTDYLSDEQSMGYLVKSDLIVYPYQHTTEPASAAVRLGIASGVPVAVTPSNIFGDVKDLVHMLPGSDVASIAKGLKKIYGDIVAKKSTIVQVRHNCSRWLKIHDYGNLSKHLYSVIAISSATQKAYRSHLHFPAGDPSLKTLVGKRNDFGLWSNRQGGVLLFGPYIHLDSGSYTLAIFGASDAPDVWGAITLKLLYGDNPQELEYETISNAPNGPLVELAFHLRCAISKFEIQITSNGLHFVQLVDVVLTGNRKIF
jgi:glycosyltransferase involved in cell wall biosynthesis